MSKEKVVENTETTEGTNKIKTNLKKFILGKY